MKQNHNLVALDGGIDGGWEKTEPMTQVTDNTASFKTLNNERMIDRMDNTGKKVFENLQFGQVRVVEKDGEPWFIAADVCRVLELDQVSRAMDRLDPEDGGLLKITHPQSLEKTIEEGLLVENPKCNPLGSILFGIVNHGFPIMGDILIIGEGMTNNGLDFKEHSEQRFSEALATAKGMSEFLQGQEVAKLLHEKYDGKTVKDYPIQVIELSYGKSDM